MAKLSQKIEKMSLKLACIEPLNYSKDEPEGT